MAKIALMCKNCNKDFQREVFRYNDKLRQGVKEFFCSNSCKGQYYIQLYPYSENLDPIKKKYGNDTKAQVQKLRVNGCTYAMISEQMEIPLSSVSYLLRRKNYK